MTSKGYIMQVGVAYLDFVLDVKTFAYVVAISNTHATQHFI